VVERDEVEKREKDYIPTQLMPQQKFCNSSAERITAEVRRLLQRNKLKAQSLSHKDQYQA
jgi:hypothetical protein